MTDETLKLESPCDSLAGRLRDICRGFDDAGEPVRLPRGQSRKAYLREFLAKGLIAAIPESSQADQTDQVSGAIPVCGHLGREIRTSVCQECGQKGTPATVFSCGKHGECTLRKYKTGVATSCLTCPDLVVSPGKKTWAVGIVTELRKRQTLERTLSSIEIGGWRPVVYADHDAFVPESAATIRRPQQMGSRKNYFRALEQLAMTGTTHVILCLDGAELCRDARELLDGWTFPADTVATLLTPATSGAYETSPHPVEAVAACGGLAIALRADTLRKLVGSDAVRKAESDDIGEILALAIREKDMKLVGWSPSPARDLTGRLAGGPWRGDTPEIAVVVVCSDYGRFLGESLESVLSQRHKPAEILVVDDASTDDTASVAAGFADRGVRYLRIERRNTLAARAAGFDATRAPILCFLDADDVLPPDYLEAGLRGFAASDVGIVYSDLEKFGDKSGVSELPAPGDHIDRMNYIHSGSLVRREALEVVDCIHDDIPCDSMNDWYLWRRVIDAGWKTAKSPARYRYRRHAAAQSIRGRSMGYFELANLRREPVTLFLPMSGRLEMLPQTRRWVSGQAWPRHLSRLLVADTSGDDRFSRQLQNWLGSSQYSDVRRYQQWAGRSGLADENRRDPNTTGLVNLAMVRIYNRMIQEATTEYILVVEDDVLPPGPDVVERLLRSFDKETAAVSGAYRGRHSDNIVAWDREFRHLNAGEGVVPIHGSGFGCLMVRRSVLASVVLTCGPPRGAFDLNFSDQVAELGFRFKLDWSIRCRHAGKDC